MEPVTLAILAAFATTGAVVAASAWFADSRHLGDNKRRDEALEELARVQGGWYTRPGLARGGSCTLPRPGGMLQIRRIGVAPGETAWLLELQLTLPELLPAFELRPGTQQFGVAKLMTGQDLQLGHPALDTSFRIRGAEPALVERLVKGEVAKTLLALEGMQGWGSLSVELEPMAKQGTSALRVQRSEWPLHPLALERLVDEACKLGQALAARWVEPWNQIRERWSLAPKRIKGSPLRSAQGRAEGFPLWVTELLDEGRPATHLVVEIHTLGGLRMAHKDTAEAQGWRPLCAPLGNPVIDMTLAVKAVDPDRARALLADEALTGDLLEVLHGLPGSQLKQEELIVVLPGHWRADLGARVEQALALAQAVRDRLDLLQRGG